MNFAKFLRTPFLTEHLRWLLLIVFEDLIMIVVFITVINIGLQLNVNDIR